MDEYRGWVALKPLLFGDRVVRPGTPCPEAEGLPLRDELFFQHELGWEGEGPAPLRFMRPPGRAFMAIHDRMLAELGRGKEAAA